LRKYHRRNKGIQCQSESTPEAMQSIKKSEIQHRHKWLGSPVQIAGE
jgi:hypothetical protein